MSYFNTGELDAGDLLVIADIPDHVETKRLVAAIPLPGNGRELNLAIQESATYLREWRASVAWIDKPIDASSCELWCRTSRANFILRCDFQFLIWDKQIGNVLGNFAIHSLDLHMRSAEIGYWARHSALGKGYMTEAGEALLKLGKRH